MNKVTVNCEIAETEPAAGQIWQHDDGEAYLLAKVSTKNFALIRLDNGDIWDTGTTSPKGAFSGCDDEFALVRGVVTISQP